MKKLSRREVEIISLAANGLTAKEIARITQLEHRTVEAYINNAKKKLSAKNIAHAIYLTFRKTQ